MLSRSEPVAIGGIAGSGTRVAAHLLRELGFYIGDELNGALDNLWFGFLLGRPAWRHTRPSEVLPALHLFAKAMRGDPAFDPAERAIIRGAVEGQSNGFEEPGLDAQAVARRRELARSMETCSGPPADAVGWGWKLPDTYVYLERLAQAFPRMRYIHLVREGSDLIEKGKTLNQVRSWGKLLGVDLPGEDPAAATRRYRERVNRSTKVLGRHLLGRRFLLLRYESICADPGGAVAAVVEFLDLEPAAGVADEFASFVQQPRERG